MTNQPETTFGAGISARDTTNWLREIKRLERKYKRLPTAGEIVDSASDPKSLIHASVYNRNKDDAARAYYIARVQFIMRHIMSIRATIGDGSAKFRVFVLGADGYERVSEIAPESATALAITRQLAQEISSARRRAEAWRAILGSAERSQADDVIGHLFSAETLLGIATEGKESAAA